MVKTGETSTDEDIAEIAPERNLVVCQKRHKKHKHKRHKRKKSSHDDAEITEGGIVDVGTAHAVVAPGVTGFPDSETRSRKCTNKGRGKKFDRANRGVVVPTVSTGAASGPKPMGIGTFGGPEGPAVANSALPRPLVKRKCPKSGKGKESATSSEEERWLDAIESGKLEEVDDELKKIKPKDPKLMTARQRAMFERKTDAEPNPGAERLVSLPSGYKEKVMTAEAIQKAALKSLKRKQLADEKREKDKKKTMERLLKKQESKASKLVSKGKAWKRQVPFVTYRLTTEASWISLPPGHEFPLGCSLDGSNNENSTVPLTSNGRRCAIVGCSNPRRYCCSKTGVPLCSLECYRANLAAILT